MCSRPVGVVSIERMGSPDSTNPGAAPVLEALPGVDEKLPDASVAPPPLLDGIVRVKVPADKIQPFLAKTALFKGAPKEVVAKVAPMLQGLECAESSELVTAGKTNDGMGILFSGMALVLLHSACAEFLPVEEVLPGDHFDDVAAPLGKASPSFAVAAGAALVNPRDNAALAELKRTLQTVDVVPVAIGLEDFNSALVRLKLLDEGGPKRTGAAKINPDTFQFESIAEQERPTDARAVGDDAIRMVNRIIAAGLER